MKFHEDKIHLGLIFKLCETYTTARKKDLDRHIRVKHYFQTSWAKNLKRHVKILNTAVINCAVQNCDVKLKGIKNLKRHLALVHEAHKRYICWSENCTFKTGSKKYHLFEIPLVRN